MRIHSRIVIPLMLSPALLVIVLLFVGGLLFAISDSLGYYAPIGEKQLTLAHYRRLWSDPELRIALWMSLLIATIASLISAVLGLAIALSFRELAARRPMLNFWLQLPLAAPHLAVAVALINLITPSGLIARGGYALGLIHEPADFPILINDRYGLGVIITYVIKETPFIAAMTIALLLRLGDEYDALARTLGASSWQRLRYVTLPLAAPATVSAALMVFAFIFGAFEVPFLLGRQYPAMLSVVAQRRYQSADLMERPGAIASAVVLTGATMIFVWVYLRLAAKLSDVEKPVIF
jgi:putative spermidine/putrescine transport system permease protein